MGKKLVFGDLQVVSSSLGRWASEVKAGKALVRERELRA
jgi:hypothetical protein